MSLFCNTYSKGLMMKKCTLNWAITMFAMTGLAVNAANGDIVTGDINSENELLGAGVAFGFTGSGHGDSWTAEILWEIGDPAAFVSNQFGEFAAFEGDHIASTGLTDSFLNWSHGNCSGEDCSTSGHIGTRDSMNYLGFRFDAEIDGVEGTRFGFMQYYLDSDYVQEWIGYSFESEVGESIVVYDMTPSPSGVALFGIAGLSMTRRRRG